MRRRGSVLESATGSPRLVFTHITFAARSPTRTRTPPAGKDEHTQMRIFFLRVHTTIPSMDPSALPPKLMELGVWIGR